MRRGADRPPVKRQAEASRPGVVTLGEVAPRLAIPEVRVVCGRPAGHGRVGVGDEGADFGGPVRVLAEGKGGITLLTPLDIEHTQNVLPLDRLEYVESDGESAENGCNARKRKGSRKRDSGLGRG